MEEGNKLASSLDLERSNLIIIQGGSSARLGGRAKIESIYMLPYYVL